MVLDETNGSLKEKKKEKSPNWSIRQKTRKAEHSLRRQPQICRGLTLELNGSVTCNDFFLLALP